MAVSRRSARPRYTLVLLVLASATLITLNYRGNLQGVLGGVKRGVQDIINPVQSGVNSALRPVGNFFEGAFNYGGLESQNQQLAQENTRLRSEQQQSSRVIQENKQLRQQLNLPFTNGIPTVGAEIVGTTPSNFSNAVVIDKGSSSGIADQMPVVSGDALVGLVKQVSRTRATVVLISDTTSDVGVRFGAGNGNVAIASGDGSNKLLRVSYVSPSTRVTKGERMFTSGLQNALYPPDIPVGTVSSAALNASTGWSISLRPAADLQNMQFLTVLQWSPGH